MAVKTRRIGLSLGADICWPICYEALLRRPDERTPLQVDQDFFFARRMVFGPHEADER